MSMVTEIDRISDLPYEVLVNILSLLRTKQAVRTSVLSKRWKNLWTYSPRVDLDERDFSCYEKFKEFGGTVLSHRETSYLDMFSISSHSHHLYNHSDIGRWVSLAMKFKPRVFSPDVTVSNYDFVECAFTCQSLEDMYLELYDLEYRNIRYAKIEPSTVNLPHLKRLRLNHVFFYEEDVIRLFAGCPMLKDLMVKNCRGEICPIFRQKLISLYIVSNILYPLRVFSETQPKIINLPCIRRLHITNAFMSKEGVARLLTGCPLLEDLSLEKCHGKFSTLFIGKLRRLSLQDCKFYGDNVPLRTAPDYGNDFDPGTIFYGAECLKLCFPNSKVELKKELRRTKPVNNLKSLSIVLADWCMHPYEIDPVALFLHNLPIIEELTVYNPKRKPELSRRGKPKPVVLCNESSYYNSLAIELCEIKNLKRVEIKFCSNLFRAHSFKEALLKQMEALVNAKVVISEYDDVTEHF